MSQLQIFTVFALRQLPAALGWVLGLLLGAMLSIFLEKEVFPNTPAAKAVAERVLLSCALALVPLGSEWLLRVAAQVRHPGWQWLWYLAALGATGIRLVLGTVLLVGFLLRVWWPELVR